MSSTASLYAGLFFWPTTRSIFGLVDRHDVGGVIGLALLGQLHPKRCRAASGHGFRPGGVDILLPQEDPHQVRVVKRRAPPGPWSDLGPATHKLFSEMFQGLLAGLLS